MDYQFLDRTIPRIFFHEIHVCGGFFACNKESLHLCTGPLGIVDFVTKNIIYYIKAQRQGSFGHLH
jgi:hypothetical protein